MVAEGLPLVLNHLMPPEGDIWASFTISTAAVALFGEILPQSIIPFYVLEFAGRSMWFIKIIMWLLAIPTFPISYALSKFRKWRLKDDARKMEGILEIDELAEFMRLHEQNEGLGGPLSDEAGALMRTIIRYQSSTVRQAIRSWTSVILKKSTDLVTQALIDDLQKCDDTYIVVLADEKAESQFLKQKEETQERDGKIQEQKANKYISDTQEVQRAEGRVKLVNQAVEIIEEILSINIHAIKGIALINVCELKSDFGSFF